MNKVGRISTLAWLTGIMLFFKSTIQINTNSTINTIKQQTMASIFVNHGGGPLPILQPELHIEFTKSLQEVSKRYPNPRGIILFSAHWEEQQWTMLDHNNPSLYYDYYNFPPQSYNLTYTMRSSADQRQMIKEFLAKQGINLKSEKKRGYDHGVFIPMMLMYPQGQVPIIQISLLESLDPKAHYRMGIALRKLKKEGFIIMGSGSSCHGGFREKQSVKQSQEFDNKLSSLIKASKKDQQFEKIATNWKSLPFVQRMHPRQQHLVPLWVVLGAHQGEEVHQMKNFLMGLNLSHFIMS